MPDVAAHLEPREVPLDDIYLDPNNPRLYDVRGKTSRIPDEKISQDSVQDQTFNRMMDRFDVENIADSIQEIGFLPIDSVVVRPIEDGYVVVEGNRRISALMHLRQQEDAGELDLDDDLSEEMSNLDVKVLDPDNGYESYQWLIQGVRHISGVKDWGPYQQAKTVESLLEDQGLSASDAAEGLGLSTRKVNWLYKALGAFEQMEGDPEYSEHVQPDMFSYFVEVMKKPDIRDDYLDFDHDNREFKNSTHIETFYSWIVPQDELDGGRKIPKAIDVRKLPPILDSPVGKKVMGQPDKDINDADKVVSTPDKVDWMSSIEEALEALDAIPVEDLEKLEEDDRQLLEDLIEKCQKRLEQAEDLG